MYRGNNRRPGARAPLLGLPPTGYEVNIALSRANNEVHTLKRQVSDLQASFDTEKDKMSHRLHHQEQAYDRMVCEQTSMVSDQKLQNLHLIEQNRCLVQKLTETEDQLADKTAELKVSNETWEQKYRALEDQQQSMDSKVTQVLSEIVDLKEKLQQQQAIDKSLEAEKVLLVKESEALAKIVHWNKSKVLELTEAAKHIALKNANLEVNNDTVQQDVGDLEESSTKALIHQQQCIEPVYITNVGLPDELKQHRANEEQLEAQNIVLKNQRDSLAALNKSQEQTHNRTESALISRIQQLENLMAVKAQEFQDEMSDLENICLYFKKKRLGIFGRRMGDRKTEMDKMRRKMQDME